MPAQAVAVGEDLAAVNQQAKDAAAQPIKVPFPTGMLCLAILFDVLGAIPGLNLITEILAGLIMGFWQKTYAPSTDPILNFIVTRIIDVCFVGLLPSNIAIVIRCYIKKKAEEKKKQLELINAIRK